MINKDILDKLQSLKNQTDDSKERLKDVIITEESGGGLVRISMNGNREIKGVEINVDLKNLEKEDLEDLLTVAFTRTIDKVNELNEKEVMSSAQSLFQGI